MKNICRDICNFCSYVSRGTGCPPGDASWQNPDAWQCIEGKSSASLKMVPTAICQQQLSLYCISTVADCKSLMYSQPQEDLGSNCRKIQTFGGYTVKLIVATYKYKNKNTNTVLQLLLLQLPLSVFIFNLPLAVACSSCQLSAAACSSSWILQLKTLLARNHPRNH